MIFEGADTAGFEADARLTAMWLWTLSTAADDVEASANDKVIKSTGYTLEYDAARKIAQGLGAHLEQLGTMVEIRGDKARLLPVAERSKALFGKEGPSVPRKRKPEAQLSFFDEVGVTEEGGSVHELGAAPHGATVLDRVHQAMLLFAAGRSEALRRLLVEEGVGQEARFWRLAQALSALYPPQTDEKRWVDGVLARKKGLGF
jgi:putative DNA methylase